jgi:hypothetical protein
MDFVRRVEDRLCLGRARYGHGVLVPCNASKNWKEELIEELLDACVYAAADVLKRRGIENDDENAEIVRLISDRALAKHEYGDKAEHEDTYFLDLCMFIANAALSQK